MRNSISSYRLSKSKRQIRQAAWMGGDLPKEMIDEIMAKFQATLRIHNLEQRIEELEARFRSLSSKVWALNGGH
ncbi:MAG: hypothetical protein ACM359_13990 [Bacillota bacterium]